MRRILVAAGSAVVFSAATALAGAQSVSPDEAATIARDAYIYAYPLVLMDVSAKVSTNVAAPGGRIEAPVNQFGHARAFPDVGVTVVARPNADTLSSSLVFDVSKGPLIVTVPDSAGRYYLLPMLDKWSDVFAAPGTRTTGDGAQTFAIVGPHWQGKLPPGVERYVSPTEGGWMGGRMQTNGKSDYDAVHAFQDGLKAVPLAAYGKPYKPPAPGVDAKLDMSVPPDQVDKMDAATFFAKFAELLKSQPPHANDYPILDRMKRIGIEPGRGFSLASEPAAIQDALNAAPAPALAAIKAAPARAGVLANGWRTDLTAIGTYGTDYLNRAGVAYSSLGATVPEDAVYPTAVADAEGRPFDSGKRYILHFDKNQLPPVRGFWSLTMYDERQVFAANPIDRFAIGDRDKLVLNADGSLDLYIQRESPGAGKESNWLPTPKSGAFTMNLRLYWPKASVLDGSWAPPSVWGMD